MCLLFANLARKLQTHDCSAVKRLPIIPAKTFDGVHLQLARDFEAHLLRLCQNDALDVVSLWSYKQLYEETASETSGVSSGDVRQAKRFKAS
jgi:hypothetical protein